MKIKFDVKKYILIIIASIIMASNVYFNRNILITSFEQCLYTIFKQQGHNVK